MHSSELLTSSKRKTNPYAKELILNYLKRAVGALTPHRSTNKASAPARQQTAFAQFYDAYAPPLWGLILTAKLPAQESETILINTMRKAWQQLDQPTLSEKRLFIELIRLAGQEGLPPTCLRAVLGSLAKVGLSRGLLLRMSTQR